MRTTSSSSAALLLVLVGGAASQAAASSQPNILFLMADQMRFDAMSSTGGGPGSWGARTPHLDALSADGLRFINAYSATPSCTPARAALLTGLSPWYNGMIGYGVVAPKYEYEMATTLHSQYFTTSIGKNHFEISGNFSETPSHGYNRTILYDGLGTGFANGGDYDDYDTWFQSQYPGVDPLASGGLDWNSWPGTNYIYPEEAHPTAWVGRTAQQFLENYTSSPLYETNPFFLKVSFHRPHSPYDPPARILNATTPDQLPPLRVGGNWDTPYSKPANQCGPSDIDAWCGEMPSENTTLARRAYYSSINFVDEKIGEIMATLSTLNLLDNTWVFFVSDHGDGMQDHFHWRKSYPYEFSSHVPMIVRWPSTYASKMPRNSTTTLMSELRDIFPTALDIAGITPPAGTTLDGLPLTCILQDPSGEVCETTYMRRQLVGNSIVAGSVETKNDESTNSKSLVVENNNNMNHHHHDLVKVGSWRKWIDMEHDVCYNITNHWNGLTDGQMKYIFIAFDATEQLFNLTSDPYEMMDVSGDPAYASTLALWRQRLVQQFLAENRGPGWVNPQGQLLARPKSQTYSPYYPKANGERNLVLGGMMETERVVQHTRASA